MTSGPLRVLLVEDSEDDAMLVLRELRAHGYEPDVHRVETASETRSALEAEDWDLVLSDFTLPTFSAPEALKVVREHDGDIPFIIISGAIGEETAVTALKSGADDFVIKGNLARLVPAIQRGLREAAARRQHREATRALSERDELLRALVEASPAGIVMVSHDGHVRIRNHAANALLGKLENGDAGSGRRELPGFREIVERALSGESVQDRRLSQQVDGGALELEVSAAPIRAPSSGVAGAVVIAIDVSHRAELEEQLRQSQKMEAVGQLAGGVAHDFNNILTAISGYADFLLNDLPAEGTLRSDAEEIRKAADRGSALTRQLLTLSRKQVVSPEHLDLGMVIVGLEKMLRRVVGEDLVFEVQAPEDLPVHADRGQIEQILMNLVVNARDAMPGGGTVSIRGARVHDPVGDDPCVLLEVADTGSGIPPEVLDRVLEPFFTTKEAGRGTGLGLSIVHGIVVQSGGRLVIDSEFGKGTRVGIYLPLHEAPPLQTPALARPSAAEPERSATILVVEDDESIRTVTVRALRDAGFRVLEAENGEAALREAQEAGGAVDLVLLDVIMPRLNGPSTAAALREEHGISRILYMSGYTGDALAQHGGADVRRNLIAKPFGQRELIGRIDEMLAGVAGNEAED